MTDDEIRDILKTTRVIAMVGYSANPARPSHGVARYMRAQGYRVIPVNPGLAGQEIEGELVYPDLASIPQTAAVDMVDIFRAPEAVPGIVDEALAHLPGAATIWMQIGVVNEAAAQAARAAGKKVIMDRCPKIEHARLLP